MTQSLDLGRLQRSLVNAPIRFELRSFSRVSSTQDLVAVAAQAGAAEGLVVFADEQLTGRGRSGRSWVAPPGSSLMFSVLLRPERDAGDLTTLSLVAGLAVVEGLAMSGGPPAQLKWPNDCLCRDLKLAGVLAESPAPSAAQRLVVLGVGCNVTWAGSELPPELSQTATACDLEGCLVDRSTLAEAVLSRLAIRYREWAKGGFAALRADWLGHAAWLGQMVIARHPSGPVEGRAVGVSEEGELIVDTADGPILIAAGELELSRGPLLRLADGVAG